MSRWTPEQYLRFADQRTRAAVDLTAAIRLDAPHRIVDLGCGPGNSTQVLRLRWPQAEVIGVDHSSEMIAAARASFPDQRWIRADARAWRPEDPPDLVFSNAALQWIPDHHDLIPRLFDFARHALAFQIPSGTFATVRTLIHEISRDPAWHDRLDSARRALTMESVEFYYDLLAGTAADLDIWETEYLHVLRSTEEVIAWVSSTGLRPFLADLENEAERDAFLAKLRDRVATAYPAGGHGTVLFPFRRTFVVAYH